MSRTRGAIAVVDDDPRVLESLENLFESAGYGVRSFSSARALIDTGLSDIGQSGVDQRSRRGEAADSVAGRFEQVLKRLEDPRIIIDDCYSASCSTHGSSLPCGGNG